MQMCEEDIPFCAVTIGSDSWGWSFHQVQESLKVHLVFHVFCFSPPPKNPILPLALISSASLYHRVSDFERCPGQWLSSWTVVTNRPASWKMTSLTLTQLFQHENSPFISAVSLQAHRTKPLKLTLTEDIKIVGLRKV